MSQTSKTESSTQMLGENPNINYPNAEALSRPMRVPVNARRSVLIIVAIACLIAAVFVFLVFDMTMNAPVREQQQIQELLDADVPSSTPIVLSLVEMSDEQIEAKLGETGDQLYEQEVQDGKGLEIIRIPSDISIEEAAAMYDTGVSKLSALQAVSLLNGSWSLDVVRDDGLNMSLHYADFRSGSLDGAIANAVESEEFERGNVIEAGDDDGFGNAFSTGTVMVGGETYEWTVSATKLSDVYPIAGLPEDSTYVGVRVRKMDVAGS